MIDEKQKLKDFYKDTELEWSSAVYEGVKKMLHAFENPKGCANDQNQFHAMNEIITSAFEAGNKKTMMDFAIKDSYLLKKKTLIIILTMAFLIFPFFGFILGRYILPKKTIVMGMPVEKTEVYSRDLYFYPDKDELNAELCLNGKTALFTKEEGTFVRCFWW